ncbi:MAG: hypothetical protein H7Y37_11860 [Anaerolineae bacterium]|nr:hypothetical protein [Gloeobacterales cyanobacterium ES-bin-313]
MYPRETISQLFGADALQYVNNKHSGGQNNAKGNSFENYFTLFQIAELAHEFFDTQESVIFSAQILAFLDDLVIVLPRRKEVRNHQIKDIADLSWGKTGLRTLVDDFEKQHSLNLALDYSTSKCLMVVSQEHVYQKLKEAMPENIKDFTQVSYFPAAKSVSELLNKSLKLRELLAFLSAFDEEMPDRDKLETIASVLLGAWISSDQSQVTLHGLLVKTREASPNYIRSLAEPPPLDPRVKEILDNLPDFTYSLTKGFLKWKYLDGLQEGTLPYSQDDQRFESFQRLLKRNQPTDFDALEVFLI